MNVSDLEKDLFLAEEEEGFDYRKLFYKILARWWWFVLSVPLCAGIAFFITVKKTPVYSVEAKVMINDTKKGELGTSAVMKELGFAQSDVFVENEMIELQSKNLMREVVKNLELNIRYFQEGMLRPKEWYGEGPVKILADHPENIRDTVLYVKAMEGNRVRLESEQGDLVFEGHFSESIPMGDYCISVEKGGNFSTEKETRVVLHSYGTATTLFYNNLEISLLEKNTNAVKIVVEDALPVRAQRIIRELIATYNSNGIAGKQLVAAKTVEFIDARLKVINRELGDIEDDAEHFKKRNQLTDLNADATFVMEQKKAAVTELLKLETELDVVKSIRVFLEDKDAEEFRILPENLGLTDESLNGGIGKYNEMVLQRSKLLQTARESNPLVTGLEAQLRGVKESIALAVGNVERGLKIKIQSLESESRSVDKRLTSVPTQEKGYRAIARQQELKEKLFLFLMQKREESEIAKLMYVPMAKIIEDPSQKGGPVSPRKAMILLIGLMLGFGLPFGGILLEDVFDTKVRGVEEVEKAVRTPVLGGLPELPEGKTGIFEEDFVMSESMHLIRENLNYMLQQRECPVIMVTSTIPQEGKSLVAAHLAHAYAQVGKKVIVVGCDLRNPRLNVYFQIDNYKGISAYLAGLVPDWKEVVNKIDAHLYAVFGGSVPPNPAQLLSSPRMKELLNQLKKEFDCIIIDTPPLGMLADGFALSKFADACVYIVRAHVLDRKALKLVTDLEKEKRLENLGIVVNGIRMGRKGYGYGYGSKYGYRYGWKYGYGYGRK